MTELFPLLQQAEWLCGDVPFHGSVAEVSAQHMNAAPPSLCEQKPTIPFAIEEVVLKALAKNPEQRYSSLLDFVKAFEDACPREPLILRESNAGPNINVRTPNSHLADTVLAVTSHSTSSPSPTSSPTSIPLGTTLHTYRGHTDVVTAVAWSSPDGAYIASASADKTVQVWDSGTGGVNASSYSGHSAAVNAVAWSPDETRIASSSADKTVQVWNASDGGNPYTYHGHSNVVYSVAWSPDGTTIASSSADKTVQIWQAT